MSTVSTKSIAKLWPQFYPYQLEGTLALYQSGGRLILGDDVGLGKTPQTIAALCLLNVERPLVVAPASVVYKWQDEFVRWDPRPVKLPQVVVGGPLITTYATVAERYDEFARHRFEALVLDECHKAKNPQAQRTKAVRKLARRIPHLIFLSGTPFLNQREELWSLLNMLDPIRWHYLTHFRNEYCNDNRGSQHWQVKEPLDIRRYQAQTAERNRAALAEAIQPYLLRRTQTQVGAQIPPMTREKVRLHMEGRMQREYNLAAKDLIAWLRVNGLPSRKAQYAQAMVKLGYLRRLVGRAKVEPSIELARDILDADPAQKVVLYAQHQDVIASLCQGLADYGVLTIVGSTPLEDRHENVRRFQEADVPRVMIISEAGEEGINLYRARTIIHVEQGWTPKSRIQAEGRIHRTGQTEPVVSIIPIIANSIDPRLDRLIERKQEEFEGVAGADAIETVTRELLRLELESA
jgi:SNF2 family DNA or RNA helicase